MHIKIAFISFIILLTGSCSTTGETLSLNAAKVKNSHQTTEITPPLKGDLHCRLGSPDCNPCANNVQQQFNKALQGRLRWRQMPWHFNWDKQYPPYQLTPTSLFNDHKKNWLGIPDHHIQGFIRTNSSRYPYAGSHSHANKGGIFIIEQASSGKKNLKALYSSNHRHPSGVQVLGKYLLFGDNKALRLINIEKPESNQLIKHPLPTSGLKIPKYRNFGGGVGMVRLAKDNYLVLSSAPGAQDSRPRFNRFYTIEGNIEYPTSIKLLSEARLNKPANLDRKFAFSENLSLVTECKTGDIYAIHTTGDEKGVNALIGKGYWRLSKLIGTRKNPQLSVISGWKSTQNIHNCHLRSTGTVYVNPQHNMEFYCHGYARSKKAGKLSDKFYFKVGQ